VEIVLSNKTAGNVEIVLSNKTAGNVEIVLSNKTAGNVEIVLSNKTAGNVEIVLSNKTAGVVLCHKVRSLYQGDSYLQNAIRFHITQRKCNNSTAFPEPPTHHHHHHLAYTELGGPLVDPFLTSTSRRFFDGLPWFLVPFGP
jgi:hypothetical protein